MDGLCIMPLCLSLYYYVPLKRILRIMNNNQSKGFPTTARALLIASPELQIVKGANCNRLTLLWTL